MASPDEETQDLIDSIVAVLDVAREEHPALAPRLTRAFAIGLRAGSEIACLELVERAIVGTLKEEPLQRTFDGVRERVDRAIKQVEQ